MSNTYAIEITEDLLHRQMELEQECLSLGETRYNQGRLPWQAKATKSPESERIPGRHLVSYQIPKVVDKLNTWMDEVTNRKGRGGNHLDKTLVDVIQQASPEAAAYSVLKTVVDLTSTSDGRTTIQHVIRRVGNQVEAQANYRRIKENQPQIRNWLDKKLKNTTSFDRNQFHVESVADWLQVDRLQMSDQQSRRLGQLLVTLVSETGMIETTLRRVSKDRTEYHVVLSEDVLKWMTKEHAKFSQMFPVLLPMIVPPNPWKGPQGGGYLSGVMPNCKLVKTKNPEYLEDLGSRDMPKVYRALNAIQDTPWRINRKVLRVLKHYHDRNIEIGKLPRKDPYPEPAKPQDIDTNEVARKEWRTAAHDVHALNARTLGKRVAATQKLWIAEKFADEDAIWFPHSLDWRGRLYPLPHLLTPQGDDVAKGVLQFAQGKPLGENGAYWLAVHIANVWGEDKIPMDDRVQWVLDHEESIMAIAMDPIDYTLDAGVLDWHEADKPFQFLAGCLEWLGFRMTGEQYVSHLPIAMDGSCSGLQHFSAMLRDPVGGKAVNLVPSEQPQDIYQAVADVVQEVVEKDAEDGSEEAQAWDGRLNRKVCKTPTMTLPYGVTKFGMQDQVLDYLLEKADDGSPVFEGLTTKTENRPYAVYLGQRVNKAVGDVVRAAPQAMTWLQDVSKVMSKEGLPLNWTTPVGFPVQQAYKKTTKQRVKTMFGGTTMTLSWAKPTPKLDKRRQASGIAPNFVHSLDASHLMLTVCHALDAGIEDFAMIHDSFGCHACDTDALNVLIREAFIEQYSHDRLEEFRDWVVKQLPDELVEELPELPAKGDLDIEAVRDSVYFFA